MRELCWRFLALFSVFARQKVTHNGNITFTDYTSGIWHPFCSKLVVNWKNSNDVTIFLHDVILTFLCFFVFSILVTGPGFMSISSLVLKLWQFPFVKHWPEIRKLEIPPSELCPISGDWDKLTIPDLAGTFLIKCYWMLLF